MPHEHPNILENFCTTHKLSVGMLSGASPTWEGQFDKYELSGRGEITGLEVQKYGEFGNNVIQLTNAIHFARRCGLAWVRISGFGPIFKPGSYDLGEDLRLLVDQPQESGPGAALRGRYFFWWGTAGALTRMIPGEAVEIVRDHLRRTLRVSTAAAPPSRSTIHIHIRGGSDIFGSSGKVLGQPGKLNMEYVQPPLAYYLVILSRWFESNPSGRVVIVSLDRSNPCVDALMDWVRADGHECVLQSDTLEEDLKCLFGATAIVAGWGTFVPMIAMLSEAAKTVYFFRDKQQGPRLVACGVDPVVVEDRCADYMKRGAWSNTPAQRQAMLDYPADCLEFSAAGIRDGR